MFRPEGQHCHQLCAGNTFASTARPVSSSSTALPKESQITQPLTETEPLDSILQGRSHKTTRSTRWLLTGLAEGTVLHRPEHAPQVLDAQQQQSHMQLSSLPFLTVAFYLLGEIEAPEQVLQAASALARAMVNSIYDHACCCKLHPPLVPSDATECIQRASR